MLKKHIDVVLAIGALSIVVALTIHFALGGTVQNACEQVRFPDCELFTEMKVHVPHNCGDPAIEKPYSVLRSENEYRGYSNHVFVTGYGYCQRGGDRFEIVIEYTLGPLGERTIDRILADPNATNRGQAR